MASEGSSLYTRLYSPADNEDVVKAILALSRPWILTYDAAAEIQQLYKERRQYLFDINYSLQAKRIGSELLIASKGLKLPASVREKQVHRPQYRSAALTAPKLQLR